MDRKSQLRNRNHNKEIIEKKNILGLKNIFDIKKLSVGIIEKQRLQREKSVNLKIDKQKLPNLKKMKKSIFKRNSNKTNLKKKRNHKSFKFDMKGGDYCSSYSYLKGSKRLLQLVLCS